jgi:hypothetical protein
MHRSCPHINWCEASSRLQGAGACAGGELLEDGAGFLSGRHRVGSFRVSRVCLVDLSDDVSAEEVESGLDVREGGRPTGGGEGGPRGAKVETGDFLKH